MSTSIFGSATNVEASYIGSDRFSTSTQTKSRTQSSGRRPGEVQMRHDQVCGNSDFQAREDHKAEGEFDELKQFDHHQRPSFDTGLVLY
jgi:hypothetical protein